VLAQATIYGRTDIGYGVKATQMGTGGTGVKQLGVMDGGNGGPRIGFRGTEDLGGGMKAHFVTEQGLSPTNGALFGVRTGNGGAQYDGLAASTGHFDVGTGGGYTQGTNRQTYVALEGGFGTVRVGYQYTAIYEISTLSGFTNTSEGAIGGAVAHTWGAGAAGGTRANGIQYISPKLGGAWTVAVQMGSGGGRELTEWSSGNTANGRTTDKQARTSLHIDYNAGPLRAAVGFTQMSVDASAGALNGAQLGTCAMTTAGTSCSKTALNSFNVYGALAGSAIASTGNETYSTNLTQLAGTYNFGAVKLGATINSGVKTVTSLNVAGGGFDTTAGSAFMLAQAAATKAVGTYNIASRAVSFNMPMGKMELVGGFSNASLDNGTTSLNDWSSSQIGAKYNFSKRTIAYGYIGTSTDNLATTATAVKQMTGSIIGIDHQF
jgi:predicted porin